MNMNSAMTKRRLIARCISAGHVHSNVLDSSAKRLYVKQFLATNMKIMNASLWKEPFRFQFMFLINIRNNIFVFEIDIKPIGIFIRLG